VSEDSTTAQLSATEGIVDTHPKDLRKDCIDHPETDVRALAPHHRGGIPGNLVRCVARTKTVDAVVRPGPWRPKADIRLVSVRVVSTQSEMESTFKWASA